MIYTKTVLLYNILYYIFREIVQNPKHLSTYTSFNFLPVMWHLGLLHLLTAKSSHSGLCLYMSSRRHLSLQYLAISHPVHGIPAPRRRLSHRQQWPGSTSIVHCWASGMNSKELFWMIQNSCVFFSSLSFIFCLRMIFLLNTVSKLSLRDDETDSTWLDTHSEVLKISFPMFPTQSLAHPYVLTTYTLLHVPITYIKKEITHTHTPPHPHQHTPHPPLPPPPHTHTPHTPHLHFTHNESNETHKIHLKSIIVFPIFYKTLWDTQT